MEHPPRLPRVRLIWADAGYTSTAGKLAGWATTLRMTLCIVARRDRHTFEVLPRRWVVERTFAWISSGEVSIGWYLFDAQHVKPR